MQPETHDKLMLVMGGGEILTETDRGPVLPLTETDREPAPPPETSEENPQTEQTVELVVQPEANDELMLVMRRGKLLTDTDIEPAPPPETQEEKPLTEQTVELTVQPETEKTSTKLLGQQSITSYFKCTKRQEKVETKETDNEELPHRTSDNVTSEESRRKLMLLGSDVVGLFPAMKEVRTGESVASQVRKSPLITRGADYKEIARYCACCRKLCGDLSEVENILPWRRKYGKGNETKGKRDGKGVAIP